MLSLEFLRRGAVNLWIGNKIHIDAPFCINLAEWQQQEEEEDEKE